MVGDTLIVAFSGENQSEESKCDVKLIVNTGCLDDDGFMPAKRRPTKIERFIAKQNKRSLKNSSSQEQKSTNQRLMALAESSVWKRYLMAKRMKSVDCGAGGNCFACVIAYFVFGDSKRHPEVRKAGIEYMKANPETFLSSFTIDDDDKKGLSKIEQFHSFITDQQQVGNYIEGPMIEACLAAYGLNGVFHMIATEGGQIKGTSFCINPNVDMYDQKTIHFDYYQKDIPGKVNGHYRLLQLQSHINTEPLCISLAAHGARKTQEQYLAEVREAIGIATKGLGSISSDTLNAKCVESGSDVVGEPQVGHSCYASDVLGGSPAVIPVALPEEVNGGRESEECLAEVREAIGITTKGLGSISSDTLNAICVVGGSDVVGEPQVGLTCDAADELEGSPAVIPLACLEVVKGGRKSVVLSANKPSEVLRLRGGVGGDKSAKGGRTNTNNSNSNSRSSSNRGSHSNGNNGDNNDSNSSSSSSSSSSTDHSNRINKGGDSSSSSSSSNNNNGDDYAIQCHDCQEFQRTHPGRCCSEDSKQLPNSRHYCNACGEHKSVASWCIECEGSGSVGACYGCRCRANAPQTTPPARSESNEGVSTRVRSKKRGGNIPTADDNSGSADRSSGGHVPSHRNGSMSDNSSSSSRGTNSRSKSSRGQTARGLSTNSIQSADIHICEHWIQANGGVCCAEDPLQSADNTLCCRIGTGRGKVSA